MDLASVVAALASVGVRVSGSAPNSSVQVVSSRACPPGLAGPEPSGTTHDLGQHFQDPNALIAEFKARIQCKHCGKTKHHSDHCFEIQRKQKEERLKTFLIQSGLSEEAAQKAVENPRRNGRTRSKRDQKLPQERKMHLAPPQQVLVLCPLSRDQTDAGGH